MNNDITDAAKLRALPWFIASSICSTFFADFTFFGGSVFVLYLSELGLDSTRIGFVYSIFPFCCIIAPLVAPLADKLGYKKTFLTFYSIRKVILCAIFFAPLMMSRYGSNGAVMLIAIMLILFALCRAVAETAQYPWQQEFIPNYIRGRVTSTVGIVSALCNVLGFAIASFVIGHYAGWGLHRFSILFALGIGIGLIGVWTMVFVPGGRATVTTISAKNSARHAREVLTDKNFLMYLLCLATMGIAGSVNLFIPVYLKTVIGIPPERVVLMDISAQLGMFLTALFWGWASDRYGSKPVIQMACLLYLIPPVCWLLMPLRGSQALWLTLPIYFITGMAASCWVTSFSRYLFNTAVPDNEKKSSYMSIYYGISGIIGGVLPIMAGKLLDLFKNLNGQILGFPLTQYTVSFLLSIGFLLLSLLLFSRLQAAGEMPFGKFLRLFVENNPIKSVVTIARYYKVNMAPK